MIKNFHYRFLLIATIICGTFFFCSVPEASNTYAWLGLGFTFGFLYFVTYKSFKGLSEERKNEILCLEFFKKIGFDFSKE